MSFTCRVLPEHRLGVVIAYDGASGDGVIQAMHELYEDPAWQPGFNVLWDARHVTQFILNLDDVERFRTTTEEVRPRAGTGRSAVVVRREVDYVSVVLLGLRTRSGREIQIFQRLPDAAEWLGVPEAVADFD